MQVGSRPKPYTRGPQVSGFCKCFTQGSEGLVRNI